MTHSDIYTLSFSEDGVPHLHLANARPAQETKLGLWLRKTKGIGINFDTLLRLIAEEGRDYKDPKWKMASKMSYGWDHAAGILPDGRVVAVGCNSDGQCDVSDWENIVKVCCGKSHTVGLRADGTVVAAGNNDDGRCNVSDWKDIIEIGCCFWQTFGIKKDGTIIDCGFNYDGPEREIYTWSNLKELSCGAVHVVACTNDGHAVACGGKTYDAIVNEHIYGPECRVTDWENVVDISCGKFHTVGLKKDGSLYFGNNSLEYGQCELADVKDAVRIACIRNITLIEHEDGRVESRGFQYFDSADGWSDVIEFAVDGPTTLGLKKDGSVICTGLDCTRFGIRDKYGKTSVRTHMDD